MRDIIFRGKRLDNGEWVYGDFVNDWSKQNTKPDKTICNNIGKYAVISETIGQYTGLKDKNGAKIFEGDYWKDPDENDIFVVEFRDAQFCFVIYGWFDDIFTFGELDCVPIEYYCTGKIEIIGNIHDNPELIGNV